MAIIDVLKRMKYSATPHYGHLVNTATLFGPDETRAHTGKLSLNLL